MTRSEKNIGEGFRIVAHTADTAAVVWAKDFSGLIDQATQALLFVLGGKRSWTADSKGETRIETTDPERVLVRWLNEMLFLLTTEDRLVVRATAIQTDSGYVIRYESTIVDLVTVGLETEVKSATYHGLSIQTSADGTLKATIVFDL